MRKLHTLPESLSEHSISALSCVALDFSKAKNQSCIQRKEAKQQFLVRQGCGVQSWPQRAWGDGGKTPLSITGGENLTQLF